MYDDSELSTSPVVSNFILILPFHFPPSSSISSHHLGIVMSEITISSLPRITPSDLVLLMRSSKSSSPTPSSSQNVGPPLESGSSSLAIIDVRDSDHIGGHIRGSLHRPSQSITESSIQDLIKELGEKKDVVFHCALSQQRGPSVALKYARARKEVMARQTSSQEEEKGKEQTVWILEGGFVKWQEV